MSMMVKPSPFDVDGVPGDVDAVLRSSVQSSLNSGSAAWVVDTQPEIDARTDHRPRVCEGGTPVRRIVIPGGKPPPLSRSPQVHSGGGVQRELRKGLGNSASCMP